MRNFYVFLVALFVSGMSFGQSTINITTSGGGFPTEKWVNITTEINGGGTQIWGQGDGSYGNGEGLINQDISIAPGTYYVNCYDRYSDGWDGTLISVTAYGSVIGDNGGLSPSDSSTIDSTSSWEDPADEIEASFEIIVPAPPSCLDVSEVSVANITDSSVDVNWTASTSGETAWEVAIQPQGTGEPAVTDGTGADSTLNPYTANSLSPDTDYEVWVRSECTAGTDFGNWVGPVNFTTLCSAIVPEYNADMSNNVPDDCWEEAGSGEIVDGPSGIGFSGWSSSGTGDDNNYGAGIFSNRINIYGSTAIRDWLISPTFDLSTGGPYQLEINVAVTNYNDGDTDDTMGSDDEVQLLFSTDGGSTWSNLTTWNASNEPEFTGTEYVEDLTAYTGNVQFALWASNGTTDDNEDFDFHVGKFRVGAIPSSATVDYCNLQFPSSGNITEGDSFTAFAQIFQSGVTDAAGQGADIEAWIGYSSIDATILADFESPNWTWVPATYNSDSGNNDEYQAEIGAALAAGSYFYASRFRYDGGVFAYGGITPGGSGGNFWDGTNFVSGELNITPDTVATFTINGCNASDTYSTAFDGNVQNVYWIELIYDGNCVELTTDTETTIDIDTEIGLYDAAGTLLGSNDDGGTDTLSSLTQQGLAAGTYYIAAGGFNTNFGSNFTVTSNNDEVGTLVINASTPNLPDYVNLQFPGEATITAGNTTDVYAQIFEDGTTQGAGAGANITAEIGISSVDATSTTDFSSSDWNWTTATYFGEVGNNDEYTLAIDASLAPGIYYYVSRFSVDGGPYVYGGNTAGTSEGGGFWDGTNNVSGILTVNPKPEPTNHVTDFTATADSDTAITLTWDDNDGTQAADGFLIVGKTGTASFYTPLDGTDGANDTDWTDDEFEVQVDSGVQTYTVTGLIASTLYEFEIYPFTNFDGDIDYKTDGTVPSASATTDADPCAGILPDYLEDFASYVPDCWEEAADGALLTGPGSFGSSNWVAEEFAHTSTSGGGAANINLWQSGDVEWLLTPSFDLSADGYEVRFDAALTDFGSTSLTDILSAGDIISLVYSNDGTNWTTIYDFTANIPAAAGETISIDLTGITGSSVQFAFFTSEGATGRDVDFHIDNFEVRTPPACSTTVVDSSTINEDCIADEFFVDIVVSSVGDGTVITDGTDSFPIVAGTINAGPFPIGSSVTLDVVHSDPACNFSLGSFEFNDCPTLVDCSGSGLNDSFCYDDNEFLTFAYATGDGSSALSILFNSGTVENCCDDFIIYDGTDDTGNILYNGSDSDLTGLVFTALSGNIYMTLDSDGSVSCGDFSESEIDYTLFCGFPPVTYTYNGSWSPSDPNGNATAGDNIVIESGDAVISMDTSCNTVIVNPGASITVNSGATLTVADATNGLTLESTSTSYSSLILDGAVSGTMNYQRHVNINGSGGTGDNDLVSAPLNGQAFNAFATANPNIYTTTGGATLRFGPFDKSSATYVEYANSETATLTAGVGYRAASNDNSDFTFTGNAETGNVNVGITNSGPSFSQWNLIGNPYPSYINIEDFLNNASNSALLDETNVGIYGYDGAASDGWDIRNLANSNPGDIMAPGQGFFVAAESDGDIEFTPSMRRTGNADDFIAGRNAELTYVKIRLNSANANYRTDFYFNANSSLGLDPGYDAALWGGYAPDFSIYSHLVAENNGLGMAIQSLNLNDLSEVVIPLGVHANAGEQIVFSIMESTLPDTIDVYLDDTVANTTTLLNTSDYILTPSADLSSTGRFYLRIGDDALSTTESVLDAVSIFTTRNPKVLHINGVINDGTSASLYDLQGRLVTQQVLDSRSRTNQIDVSDYASGVYVVTLTYGSQGTSKKVVIH